MPLREDFIRKVKKDNWTFSLRKSSLGPLIATLLPNYNPVFVAAEYVQIPDAKQQKYKKSLAWLQTQIPSLPGLIAGHGYGVGLTDQVYAPGKEVRRKDVDNRWYTFELQEKGNSCGCASVRTVVKAFPHIPLPSEEQIRNDMSLWESGIAHQGVAKSNHDWENVGSVMNSLARILVSYGLKSARTVVGHPECREALKNCSGNAPGIVGWWWGSFGDRSNGGHWTVCVGQTKDGTRLVILDPWNGVQYVDLAEYWRYVLDNGTEGWFSPRDTSDVAVLVTFEK